MENRKNNFYKKHVFMCTSGKRCSSLPDNQEIFNILKKRIMEKGLSEQIRINKSGCMNWCDVGHVLVIYPEAKWYSEIKIEDVDNIIEDIINKPVK